MAVLIVRVTVGEEEFADPYLAPRTSPAPVGLTDWQLGRARELAEVGRLARERAEFFDHVADRLRALRAR